MARSTGRTAVALAAVLACLLLACAVLAGSLCAATASASEASGPDGNGAPSELAVALDDIMAERGDDAPAAVIVADAGGVAERRLYGTTDGATPTTGDAVFSWGHVSDELVWVAVMQLVEQGELRLEDAVSSRLPDGVTLPQGYGSLTLLDLMNHATGLNVSPAMGTTEAEDIGSSSIAALLAGFDVQGAFDIGELVAYSPYNVALAAAAVEQASGEDICSYVQEHIFDVLELSDTAVKAGGRPSRMARSADARTAALGSRLVSTPDLLEESLVGVTGRPALTCLGTADDLARFELALLGGDGASTLFENPATGAELLSVTRTYPSSGVERIAHGLFALPGAPGVYGIAGSSSGYTSVAFVEPASGVAVVVLAARSSVQDEALTAVRRALGVGDGLEANVPASDGDAAEGEERDLSAWSGIYEVASHPAHGITKILSVFQRTLVDARSDGTVFINLEDADTLGSGAVARDGGTDAWNALYRFYVGVASGREFSQVTSDAYALPLSTLTLEVTLLVGGAVALLVCGGYATIALAGAVRARMRGRRNVTQVVCVVLSLMTSAAAIWVLTILLGPGAERVLLSLVVTRVLSLVYVVVALALLLWLVVTRWRGTFREPRRLLGCALVGASSVVMVLNFVYWEMLP